MNLGTLTREFLQVRGFEVTHCLNGESGLNAFRENGFDLCILDIMMPKLDGFSLAREIVKMNNSVPFIFLTAKAMLSDRIDGLKTGADDYITKPFSTEELLLRINAILKRTAGKSSGPDISLHSIGKYTFDYSGRVLRTGRTERKLTSKESELLRLLCINSGRTLTRTEALTRVWNNDNYFTSRSMDVYITKLRNYLKDDKNVEIVNIHGSGFRLQLKK